MKSTDKTRALGLYAQMLAHKFRIKLVFSNIATACTDSKTIQIGEQFKNLLGDQSTASVVFGLVAHEAMHLAMTDFEAFKSTANKSKYNSVLLKHLTNIVEDVWGEREFVKNYPGIWGDILKSNEHLIEKGLFKGPDQNETHPANVLCNWWLFEHLALHYPELPAMKQFSLEWRTLAVKTFGVQTSTKGLNHLDGIAAVCSTAEAIAYSMGLLDIFEQTLKTEQQAKPPKAAQAPSPDKEQSEASEESGEPTEKPADTGQGDEGGAIQDSQGSAGQSSDSQELEDEKDKTGSQDGNDKNQPANASTKQEGQIPSVSSSNLKALESAKDEDIKVCTDRGELLADHAKSITPRNSDDTCSVVTERPKFTVPHDETAYALSQGIARQLAGGIENVLQSETDVAVEYGRQGVRLGSSKLAQIKMGDLAVFERLELGEDLDVAVVFNIDGSGSMVCQQDATLWDKTVASTLGAAKVLGQFNIPFGIVQFSEELMVHHDLHDPQWRAAIARSPGMLSGGTCTEAGVQKSALMLLEHTAKRKICLTITDGEPNRIAASVAVANEAKAAGIECAFLFLGNEGQRFKACLEANQFSVSQVPLFAPEAEYAEKIQQALLLSTGLSIR